MADFAQTRSQILAASGAVDESARRLHEARLALARLKTARRTAERGGGQGGTAEADQRIAAQEAEIGKLAEQLGGARGGLAGTLESFAVFTDPRQSIGELDDQIPILLLPLRVETRFKPSAAAGAAGGGELWVRVYPDDIAVDAFETTLSESEIIRTESYWANIWRSGGNTDEDRGAWAVLAGAAGSGRAWWLTRQYRPLNEADKPVKDPAVPSMNLVFVAHAPLTEPELGLARTFWEAWWRAGADAAAQQGAVDDLVAGVGAEWAEAIRKDYAPHNLADPPPPGSDPLTVPVAVVQLVFPADGDVAVREGGWSQAPHVDVMPDRLVLLGYEGDEVVIERLGNPIPPSLRVGPDPAAPEDEHIRRDGEDIFYGEELAWIADFDRAVDIGMGFRVELDAPRFSRGFDKLLVLGVRLGADETAGQTALETLFDHHQHGRAGLSILPQGRPTNNIEDDSSGYSWREDPNVSFDHYFGPAAADPAGWFERSDGRWLATCLGIKPQSIAAIPFYRHTDIGDAFAMNAALWPTTIGYLMDSMLDTVFETPTIESTRDFFARYVTARGVVPAIRVGKQPYGILPAAPRSRLRWHLPKTTATGAPSGDFQFLRPLYAVLRQVDADWTALREAVSFIGRPGDQHQNLLDVVGLHPASIEFYQRYAESAQHLHNLAALNLYSEEFWEALDELLYVGQGLSLLSQLGWERGDAEIPDLLEKLFLDNVNRLGRDLIDDRPLSETDPIRAYAPTDRNYLAWLADAAETSHDALRLQQGFTDGVPTSLLYLMLRHALDLSFVEVSRLLYLEAELLAPDDYRALRRDARFLQIRDPDPQDQQVRIGSRWDHLYRRDAAVTGSSAVRVAEYIPTIVDSHVATAWLGRQIAALRRLEKRPTAALERLFVEHLDLCTYRLDAWWGGMMNQELALMRGGGARQEARPGLYLGAFGWIENLRPENKVLSPVTLDGELGKIFNKPKEPPLTRDSANAGYIHAPSLNHAVTAAILRNGYLSNADPSNPGSLAVNLSSERVRLALGILEGMRGEQSLAALLGYQFERGLHDRHDVEVDEYIYDLRKAFPLRGDRFSSTRTGAADELGEPLSAKHIEARNVIDGLGLVEQIRASGNSLYPFDKAGLPDVPAAQRDAISAEAARIADIADAVADLAMAESVHQVAQGNYTKAGATLDTYAKGKFPSIPDVVTTPRSGVTLTHHVALHLESGLDPGDAANISPRARAEPALNRWLATILPSPSAIVCRVTATEPVSGTSVQTEVSQADLGLAPIDLLYMLDAESQTAMRALDDAVALHVRAGGAPPRPNAGLAIDYRSRIGTIPGHVPFFELAALVRSLRALLLRSRPLRATDMSLANEAERNDDSEASLDITRAVLVRAELDSHRTALDGLRAALEPKVTASDLAAIAATIDADVQLFAAQLLAISAFDHPDLGPGSVLSETGRIFGLLDGILRARIASWQDKLDSFDAAIAAYDPVVLPDDNERFIALHRAETKILAVPSVRPAGMTPDDFLTQLTGTTRPAFVAVHSALETVRDNEATLGGLYAGLVAARAAIPPHDVEALDLAEAEAALLNLAADLASRAVSTLAAVDLQLAEAQAQIAAHGAAVEAKAKLKAATAALAALLGSAFLVVPEFRLGAGQAQEWGKAWGGGPQAATAILDHLRKVVGRALPVDDWAAGVARVREKVRQVERIDTLAGMLGGGTMALQPLQFPHRDEDYWLGLEHPPLKADGETLVLDEDKLLYTGVFATPFAAASAQAGLLLDEWTETIPGRTEDTGLTFHYDRPNSEPPQTMLLALPADFTGSWSWADLVDTVHETMDLARRRAIEPTQIDGTGYARFLPATVSAVTVHPITASLNFAFANNLAVAMAAAAGGDE